MRRLYSKLRRAWTALWNDEPEKPEFVEAFEIWPACYIAARRTPHGGCAVQLSPNGETGVVLMLTKIDVLKFSSQLLDEVEAEGPPALQ